MCVFIITVTQEGVTEIHSAHANITSADARLTKIQKLAEENGSTVLHSEIDDMYVIGKFKRHYRIETKHVYGE